MKELQYDSIVGTSQISHSEGTKTFVLIDKLVKRKSLLHDFVLDTQKVNTKYCESQPPNYPFEIEIWQEFSQFK